MRLRGVFFCLFLTAAVCFAQKPNIFAGGVVNGASFTQGTPIAPGSLVSIFGSELGAGLAQADSIPLATALLDTRVLFNGIPGPMLFLFPGNEGASAQINVQAPWEIFGSGGGNTAVAGTVQVVVERGGVRSDPIEVEYSQLSPAIFTVEFGAGQAAATNALTGVFSAPAGFAPGAVPIRRGEFLTIWCNGLGPTDPPAVTGNNSLDQVRFTATPPMVHLGDVVVQGVAPISPQFVGVYQVNVEIPPNAPVGDAVPLFIEMGEYRSQENVTVAIQK